MYELISEVIINLRVTGLLCQNTVTNFSAIRIANTTLAIILLKLIAFFVIVRSIIYRHARVNE